MMMKNRLVALITNVKPGKLRDVMSEGLVRIFFYQDQIIAKLSVLSHLFFFSLQVLCASNEDHSVVEPLLPPAGAKPGERVSFSGYVMFNDLNIKHLLIALETCLSITKLKNRCVFIGWKERRKRY